MNCQACPYQKQIDRLRRRCLACNAESDGGTPHGRVKADEFTLNAAPRARDFDRTPSGQATDLSPDDEHRLRLAMSSLFALDPIDFLLVRSLMLGRSLESFGDQMTDLADQIRRYHGSPRAMAWARKEKLLAKFPQISAVITRADEADAAGRVRKALEAKR